VTGEEENRFMKRGEGLLEYGIFKIDLYRLSLYSEKESSEVDIYQGKKSSKLELKYERDIEKAYSNLGWVKGLEKNLGDKMGQYEDQLNWLKTNTPSVRKGDLLEISVETSGVSLKLNGTLLAQSNDIKLREIILLPWLGQNPVDDKLKRDLLGLK